MMRSVTSTKGPIEIQKAIDELFSGRIDIGNKSVELLAQPSTVVIDGLTIVLASQIYSRNFTSTTDGKPPQKTHFKGVTRYDEFYKIRRPLNKHVPGDLTWLGAPSFVFSYANRQLFKEVIGRTCVNIVFDVTSFNSTSCIKDAHLDTYLKGAYCDRLELMKTFCNDKKKYRTHSTFRHGVNNPKTRLKKFITNFKDVEHELRAEQVVVNRTPSAHGVQRYNEMLSYFYPWDLVGIEIGGIAFNRTLELLDAFETAKETFVAAIKRLMKKDDADLRQTIKEVGQNIKRGEIKNIDDSAFIFTKFLLSCECVSGTKAMTVSQIRSCVDVILKLLETPLILYEYGRLTPSDGYRLLPLPRSNMRRTRFELYEQVREEKTKRTILTYSKFQMRTEALGARKTLRNRKRPASSKKRTRRNRSSRQSEKDTS